MSYYDNVKKIFNKGKNGPTRPQLNTWSLVSNKVSVHPYIRPSAPRNKTHDNTRSLQNQNKNGLDHSGRGLVGH